MSLLNLIKKDADMRKLFGEKELKIIEKQLMGVKLKQSEITRLSRDIRKKLNAIKKIGMYSSEFELKKGLYVKDMIKEAQEVIFESVYFRRIKRILLFGSSVENTRSLRSDIDIAVEFFDISVKEATKFRIEVMSKLNDIVDIQVYNILPEKIKNNILKKHKVLYKNE
jgi:predicted nucleotidyltransferase